MLLSQTNQQGNFTMTIPESFIYLPIFIIVVIKIAQGGSIISIKNINIGSFRK